MCYLRNTGFQLYSKGTLINTSSHLRCLLFKLSPSLSSWLLYWLYLLTRFLVLIPGQMTLQNMKHCAPCQWWRESLKNRFICRDVLIRKPRGAQFDGLQSTRSLSPQQPLSGPHHAAYQLRGCRLRMARIRRPCSLNFVFFFLLCMLGKSLNTWTCKTWEPVPKYRRWRTCEKRDIWFITSIIIL